LGALSTVVDATENGQTTARSIAPDTQITDRLDVVLRNDQIHGVALATPAETHADFAIQAMQAGKDVFVEKPMALTLEDAEKMKR
jgi:UDP-2-acetamido-3-amino-2,3-dideoxy-glucuronate N-acetyltransferase